MTIERVRTFLGNPRNNGRGTDPEALLRHLLSFDGECAYCGHPMEREGWDHIEHIDPAYSGGPGSIDNLLPACASCNREKHHFDADGWYHRLSTQRPHWPGALHQRAIEVRASHGLDEDTFLALRAATIATEGEGRMREDERRAREEAARIAAEAEAQRERDMAVWRNANQHLIEAEAQRIAAALPPRVVEKVIEVEKAVEVVRPRRWRWLITATAVGLVATIAALGGGYALAASTVEPERLIKAVPVVKWKTRTVVKWKTKTVYKTVATDTSGATADPGSCKAGYDLGYRDGRDGNDEPDTSAWSIDSIAGYDAGYPDGQIGSYYPHRC